MRYVIAGIFLLLACPCLAWNGPCYSAGSVKAAPFPKGNRAIVTLEASRVVSVNGSNIIYDLGSKKILIRVQGSSCKAFLSQVKKGRCNAKGLVTLEPDTGTFSDSGNRFKALPPTAH